MINPIDRLRELTGCRTDRELAHRLGRSDTSIGRWRQEARVPGKMVASLLALGIPSEVIVELVRGQDSDRSEAA